MTLDGREVLVRGRERIGDVVVTFPALKLLRMHLPGVRITYVTSSYAEELIRASGLADRAIPIRPGGLAFNLPAHLRLRREVRSGRFGRIFLFEGAREYGRWIGPLSETRRAERRAGAHAAEGYAEAVLEDLGLPRGGPLPSPRLEMEDRPEVSAKLAALGLAAPGDAYLVMHPGSYRTVRRGARSRHRKPDKRWPLERFREVSERILERFPGLKVVLVGARDERKWVAAEFGTAVVGRRVVDLTGRTGITDVLQVLKHAALLLSNDSGVMHLASVTGTPLVALFGPTDERVSGPFGMGEEARRVRALPLEEARSTPDCMERIGVEVVLSEVVGRLQVALAAGGR